MKKIHLIGNAHLDPVWLWRWQEGFAEIKATFKSALDRMKEFPDFKFTSACSVYYMWIEKSDKKMFDEIVARVKEGRWNIVGGWFLQPDCNLPSGEAFARHALISQRYFKEKFGITVKTGYNVDSFGHNGSLPKILKNSGMDNYIFMRPMPHEKNLPQSLFLWESMDGSQVNTYRIPFFYNIDQSRFEVFEDVKNLEEPYDMMAFYGVGNHGGGPTIELIDRMKRELDDSFVMSTPDEYFEAVKGENLPVVSEDLQFHAKGCYSACSDIKSGNRAAENALGECERFSVLSGELTGCEYPGEALKTGWENVLFNQFHDILGGCSIMEAYTDAKYAHGESMNIAAKNTNFALQQISWNIDTMDGKELKPYKPTGDPTSIWTCEENIGTPIVVFNPLAHDVKAVVSVREMPALITDNDGNPVPMQTIRDSKTNGMNKFAKAFYAEIPALGYRVYRMYNNAEEAESENSFVCTDSSIENEYIKLVMDEKTGEIKNIFDKKNNRSLLSANSSTILVDETHCDTWAHDIAEFKDVVGVFEKGSVKLIEKGPARATLRSVMSWGNSEIVRDYTIIKDSAVISVKTKIDFHEKHKMLKFCLSVNAENPEVYNEIPFGFIARPNDGKEQTCQSWMAMCENNSGLAVANDSKYSFDADKNVLSLTVLRGAIYADHFGKRDEFCEYMEQGIHRFEYSIFPFESLSDTEKKAQELNNKPVLVTETFHEGNLGVEYSGINVSKENIIVTAIKKAEDENGIVIRCYEAENKDTDVKINLFGTEFSAHFGHSEVKTFIVADGKAEEVDFMEWRK